MTKEELLKHDHLVMADGTTVFKGADFNYRNFTGIELTDYTFQGCIFTGAKFLAARLQNVQFITCSMGKVDFNDATLNNVNFWKSYVADATFNNANLVDVHGQFVDFSRVDFLTATVTNAFIWMGNFDGAKANPEAGFRTKRGGDGPRYKVPVVCDDPAACEQCNQGCHS